MDMSEELKVGDTVMVPATVKDTDKSFVLLSIPDFAAVSFTPQEIAAWNRRADGWQPIETAPKDTDVLVFTGYSVKVASLVDDFDPDPPKWMDNHGWDLNPICWQPLPPPPTTGETV